MTVDELKDYFTNHENRTAVVTMYRANIENPDQYIKVVTNLYLESLYDAVAWCSEYVEHDYWFTPVKGTFWFTNTRDAALFKLTWA